MNSLQITKQNINYINKNSKNKIFLPKEISKSPFYLYQKFNYGAKIREKNNYTIYISSSGCEKPKYEERQKGNKIKINKLDNFNNIQKKNKNIKIYDEKNDSILSSSDNYGYKETKNIKYENPNLKIVTIHERLSIPRKRQEINNPRINKKLIINNLENTFWHKEYSPNKRIIINNRDQLPKLRENKSSDNFQQRNFIETPSFKFPKNRELQEIIEEVNNNNYYNSKIINEDSPKNGEKNGDYFIKVTTTKKEVNPNNNFEKIIYQRNNNGKIVKITKNGESLYNNKENCSIYQRKNIKRDNYDNEPYYIGNYGDEENYEFQEQYKLKDNYGIKEEEKFGYKKSKGYQNKVYMKERDFDNYDYFMNDQENDYIEDINNIKNIKCPVHGKISIIIHNNPFGYN